MEKTIKKSILVTTSYRGVFYGEVPEDYDLTQRTMRLENAMFAIYWATKRGVAELASEGPNSKSKIGSSGTIEALHEITAVWSVSEKAVKAWKAWENEYSS